MLKTKDLLEWFQSRPNQPYTIPKGHLLIELLVYTPPESNVVLDISGRGARMESKIYPFAKILDRGEDCSAFAYDLGSVVTLNSKLAHVKESTAYALWAKEYKNERPQKVPAPTRYEGMIIDWQDRYHFPLNRFMDPTGADLFRFCIPEALAKAIIYIDALADYLKEFNSTEIQESLKVESVFSEMQKGNMKHIAKA